MLTRVLRVLLGLGSVLFALGMVILAMSLGRGAMGLCSGLMKFRRLVVFVWCAPRLTGQAAWLS